MLRSNRLLVAALVGLAAFNPVSQNSSAQEAPGNRPEPPKADPKPVDLRPIQDALEGLTGAVKSLKDNPEAEAENERANRDLQAQQDMAKWAEKLFWATVASLLLTLAGIFLIWRTLVHTKRAADAGDKMERIATQAMIAERRAWLKIVDFRGRFVWHGNLGDVLAIELNLKNVGNSPASSLVPRASITEHCGETHQGYFEAFDNQRSGSLPANTGIVVFPGESAEVTAYMEIDEAWFAAGGLGGLAVSVLYDPISGIAGLAPAQTCAGFFVAFDDLTFDDVIAALQGSTSEGLAVRRMTELPEARVAK